jgi:hypothetical protein
MVIALATWVVSTSRSAAGSFDRIAVWEVDMLLTSVLLHLGSKPKPRPFSEYLPFQETLESAQAAGLSAGDYIEKRFNQSRGSTVQTIEAMASLGVFDSPLESICEIGPGSGRYLEKVVAKAHPDHYEIYETATEWANWLVERHEVISRKCDGRTLAETESGSVALVHAHKVFPCLPFLTTISYFKEMARSVRNEGWIVFDIMTEACFSSEHLRAWYDVNPCNWSWSPHMIAREFTLKLFDEQGISLVGSFQIPLWPAITECMVFRKTQ